MVNWFQVAKGQMDGANVANGNTGFFFWSKLLVCSGIFFLQLHAFLNFSSGSTSCPT